MASGSEERVFLENDAELPGQKYVCLSFISPEKVMPQKEHYFCRAFLKHFDIDYKVKGMRDTIHRIFQAQQNLFDRFITELRGVIPEGHDYRDRLEKLAKAMRPRVETGFAELDKFIGAGGEAFSSEGLESAWEDFMFTNRKRLEDEFHKTQDFHTTIRGLKVRGTYDTYVEADARAKSLARIDPIHNIYIGSVGFWLPWDPSPNDVKDQQYQEGALNEMMKRYKENEEKKHDFYQKDKALRAAAARDESIRLAKETNEPLPDDEELAKLTAGVAPITERAANLPVALKPGGMTEEEIFELLDDPPVPQNTVPAASSAPASDPAPATFSSASSAPASDHAAHSSGSVIAPPQDFTYDAVPPTRDSIINDPKIAAMFDGPPGGSADLVMERKQFG